MQRNSMKSNSMAGAVSLLKPPKPPCWRDFVNQAQRVHGKEPNVEYGEPNKTHVSKSGVHDPSEGKSGAPHPQGGTKPGKPLKRVRAKIRRTRSQHVIHEEDLPEGALTCSLAETKPQEFGLRSKQLVDDRLYLEENTRRCQTWLASIEACEPLDEIAYTQVGGEEGVEVEVPEEGTHWDEEGEELRPPFNTSASSSEEEGNTSLEFENIVPGLSIDDSKCLERDKLLRSSSAKDVHDKLIRKKILSIPEHTGLE